MSEKILIDTFEGRFLRVALLKNVTNIGELKFRLTDASNEDCAALIRADLIPDVRILQLSAFKVLKAAKSNKIHTKSPHTELVYNISGSKHVAETLRRFGVNDDTPNLLVARFDASDEQWNRILSSIQGDLSSLDELDNLSNFETLDKYYKITKEELASGTRLDSICLRMACRDYV